MTNGSKKKSQGKIKMKMKNTHTKTLWENVKTANGDIYRYKHLH